MTEHDDANAWKDQIRHFAGWHFHSPKLIVTVRISGEHTEQAMLYLPDVSPALLYLEVIDDLNGRPSKFWSDAFELSRGSWVFANWTLWPVWRPHLWLQSTNYITKTGSSGDRVWSFTVDLTPKTIMNWFFMRKDAISTLKILNRMLHTPLGCSKPPLRFRRDEYLALYASCSKSCLDGDDPNDPDDPGDPEDADDVDDVDYADDKGDFDHVNDFDHVDNVNDVDELDDFLVTGTA